MNSNTPFDMFHSISYNQWLFYTATALLALGGHFVLANRPALPSSSSRSLPRGGGGGDKEIPEAPAGFLATIKGLGAPDAPFFLVEQARAANSKVFALLGGKLIVVTDPAFQRQVLFDKLTDKPKSLGETLSNVIGWSMFTRSNLIDKDGKKKWEMARHASATSFVGSCKARFVEITQAHLQRWIQKVLDPAIASKTPLDLRYEMTKLTFGIVLEAAYEYTGDYSYDDYAEHQERALREYIQKQKSPIRKFLGTLLPSVRKAKESCEYLHTFCGKVLASYRANKKESGVPTVVSVIDALDGLTDVDKVSEIVTHMTGGLDTTGSILGNTCVLTAQYPNETKASTPAHVLLEAKRYMPASAMGSIRTIGRDMDLGGLSIPKDSTIMCPQIMPNRDGDIYKSPDTFDPSRWEKDSSLLRPEVFSSGPRDCVGRLLGDVMLDTISHKLLTDYKFSIAKAGDTDYFFTFQFVDYKLLVSSKK